MALVSFKTARIHPLGRLRSFPQRRRDRIVNAVVEMFEWPRAFEIVLRSAKVGITEPFADAMPLRFAGGLRSQRKAGSVAIVLLLLAYAEGERPAQLLGDGSH
jgi:hypothetical protein